MLGAPQEWLAAAAQIDGYSDWMLPVSKLPNNAVDLALMQPGNLWFHCWLFARFSTCVHICAPGDAATVAPALHFAASWTCQIRIMWQKTVTTRSEFS